MVYIILFEIDRFSQVHVRYCTLEGKKLKRKKNVDLRFQQVSVDFYKKNLYIKKKSVKSIY